MKFYKIEIDETIWNYLKNHADPFEDTPNTVLRRLLFGKTKKTVGGPEIPSFTNGIPRALQQTLEVIYEMKKVGRSRSEATNIVAQRKGTAPQTIIDKYCRQLNKKAYEVDQLLQDQNLHEFKQLLERKFPNHHTVIRDFFKLLEE
ncbi:MAG TPA: hypothetical protein ENH35_03160 [Candidatus Moranbacteria bacterium]|nr:hypothetical protein BMS3Bbin08_01301 [bacterium BMS3Bbin08]HDZ85518.1 hypothetical protein [Candidatus Moranbacteria bacterium]